MRSPSIRRYRNGKTRPTSASAGRSPCVARPPLRSGPPPRSGECPTRRGAGLSNRLVVRQRFDLLVSDLVTRAAEELFFDEKCKSAPGRIRTADPLVRRTVFGATQII